MGNIRFYRANAQGCCLVGHPDYDGKLGFKNISGLVYKGVPEEVFLAPLFNDHIPQGNITFHEGFKTDGQPDTTPESQGGMNQVR